MTRTAKFVNILYHAAKEELECMIILVELILTSGMID